jgi:hypothetical protein
MRTNQVTPQRRTMRKSLKDAASTKNRFAQKCLFDSFNQITFPSETMEISSW